MSIIDDGASNTNPSTLWEDVANMFENFDLETFRSINSINSRLGVWNAKEKSTRYYKSLMYEFALYLNEFLNNKKFHSYRTIVDCLNKIKNQNLGSPPTILFEDFNVSLDYLLGLEEYIFCYEALLEIDTVCEIGAGFGRTCHTLVSLSNIKSYTIVDLPNLLLLSKAYLSQVLDKDDFEKIIFVPNDNYSSIDNFDLSINIDSMQEMPNEIGLSYLEFISNKAKLFFTKNAIGKYSPNDIDLEITNKSQFDSALEMGLINERIKMFDSFGRKDAVNLYHKRFCPDKFSLLKTQRGFGQFVLYELSLFGK